ncbi:hypothetical protein CRG98_024932 [Punica granatum]|uniref:Uncharacterized protein n=1 Tax=Punica granatum TaxID=22663 RepID=A0A2I0JEI4_PUNGR|nr:hypothetical protein CRG98_024932 [Punica granatum]
MVLICIDSNDPIMQEEALSLVLNLNLNDDNKVVLVTERAIGKIATALRDNLASCRALAATIIMSLAVVEVNMTLIGEKRAIAGGVVPILLDIVDSGLKRAIECWMIWWPLCCLAFISDGYLVSFASMPLPLFPWFWMSSANGGEGRKLGKEKIETRVRNTSHGGKAIL